LAKEHADLLLEARLVALNPQSGLGERGRGGRRASRAAAAAPPLLLADQDLYSNEDERISAEQHLGSEHLIEYSSDGQAALQNDEQLIPLLTSQGQAAERAAPVERTRSKKKGPMQTIREETEAMKSQERGTPQEKPTTRRSKRAASITDADSHGASELPASSPATQRRKTSASAMEETLNKSLERQNNPSSANQRKRALSIEDGNQPVSRKKTK
jgi:hypothetical protein